MDWDHQHGADLRLLVPCKRVEDMRNEAQSKGRRRLFPVYPPIGIIGSVQEEGHLVGTITGAFGCFAPPVRKEGGAGEHDR